MINCFVAERKIATYESLERNHRISQTARNNNSSTIDPNLAAQVVHDYLLPMFTKRRKKRPLSVNKQLKSKTVNQLNKIVRHRLYISILQNKEILYLYSFPSQTHSKTE